MFFLNPKFKEWNNDTCKSLGWEQMKVLDRDGKVIKFGKDIPVTQARREYIGLAKFKKLLLNPLFDIMRKLIKIVE